MAKKKKEKTWLAKTGWRSLGVIMMLIVVLWWISCLSFNINDSSYNTASSYQVKNILGLFGARSADFMLTYFGLALPLFLLVPFIWGYTFFRMQKLWHPYIRVFAFVLGMLCFSAFLGIMPQFLGDFKLGGNIGVFLVRNLLTFFNGLYVFAYSKYVIALVLLVLSFMSFNMACGITFKSWCNIGFVSLKLTLKIGGLFKNLFSMILGWRRDKGVNERPSTSSRPKKIREKAERKEPKLKEEPRVAGASVAEPMVKMPMKVKSKDDGYRFPDISLLAVNKNKALNNFNDKELDSVARQLEDVLQEFGVNGKIVKVRPGPVVTLYELEPSPGTKTARVIGLADDIARSMSAKSVRIAVVSGSNTIGIEMPNKTREMVYFRDLLECKEFNESMSPLSVTLGKDIGGKNVYADLAKMPHLLVAGTTGSGKSVGVNTMILSILYRMRPDECKFIMIDPKMLEFSLYNGIPHLLTPVITDPAKAVIGLKWAVKEMEDRYRAMAKLNVRNILGYNQRLAELRASGEVIKRTVQTGFDMETGKPLYEEQELDLTPLPYIVVVVDEMADLMLVAGKDVEAAIQRLAQMARAAGIHLIMSTQRPSVDVITGTIKANFPTRISFQVTSKIDSRTILGEQGAEQLLGMGDMLYMPAGQRPIRVHASFVKDSEIEQIVEFIKSQKQPEYVEGVTEGELNDKGGDKAIFDNGDFGSGSDEDLYAQAVAIVQNDKKASTSYVQRKLRIGYNRAASLIDKMEDEGIISAADHVGRREVL